MIALAKPDNVKVLPGRSGDSEWYTPSKYAEGARLVMGRIDLDPASCAVANQIVRATHYYTKEDDGLVQPFYGRIYCNPPFGRINGSGKSVIGMFVTRIVQEYHVGHVQQAILLLTAQVTTSWFKQLWQFPICFVDHRVHFNKIIRGMLMYDSRDSHMLGTIFVYLGPNEQSFVDVFSEFGPTIPGNVAVRKQTVQPLSLWEVQHA